MRETPTLNSSLIFLEPLSTHHVCDEYVRWLNDPEVHRFLDVRFNLPQTKATLTDYVSSFNGVVEKYGWMIRACVDGEMVGSITIPTVDRRHLTAGIGMMIGNRSFWGTSAAREALDLVIEFAFKQLGVRRLVEHNVALNHQSNFMLRRAGFTHEGTIRQAYRLAPDSNTFVDGFEFGLLADEWHGRTAKGRAA